MNLSTDFIPFARPRLGPEEEEAVLRVLRSGWLTTGQETKAFEEEFAAFLGCPQALAVNSATSGLHLALEALGVGPGDRVAVPTWTFTATAEVIRYLGGHPVFVDCAPGSFQMSMDHLEKIVGEAPVKVVMAVHIAGESVDVDRLLALREKYGFAVVEDSAHAFPVKTPQGWLGTIFDVGVFSFYANKTITTGEGGMIVTLREDLAKRMATMRLHGIDRDAFSRFTSPTAGWEYDILAPGFKYNLPDLGGAIGRVQLKKAQEFLLQRQEIVQSYLSKLQDNPAYILPSWRSDHAWHLFILRISEASRRNQLVDFLKIQGIGTSVHYKPLHRMTYWKQTYDLKQDDYPEAEKLFAQVVSLPLYPGLKEIQIHRVVNALEQFSSGINHGQNR